MIDRRTGFLAVGLAMLYCAPVQAAVERVWEDWETQLVSRVAGSAESSSGVSVSSPVVTDSASRTGKQSVVFSFDFPSDPSSATREAESAKLEGSVVYATSGASGTKAVGAFGENAGDSITFTDIPKVHEITVFYNNGTGSPKQCSLYVRGEFRAKIKFEDTGGWYTPFRAVTFAGEVEGEVRLQVEKDDLAANGTFCCNVDRIVAGRAKPPEAVTVRLPLNPLTPTSTDTYVTLAVRAPKSVAYELAVEDEAATNHVLGSYTSFSDGWERICVPLDQLAPALRPGESAALTAITLNMDGLVGVKGQVFVDDVRICEAWPNNPASGCPSPKSTDIRGVKFTGRHREYTQADTWYPSWATDGRMYSPYTDGTVDGIFSRSDNAEATTGMAKIEGDDPLNLKVSSLGLYTSKPWPYATRYPCGSLVHNGVWYYGTYIINGDGRPQGETTYQGPFVGFRYSRDYGKTWTETPCTPLHNLFREVVDKVPGGYSKIKMCSPHFVDFGRNMRNSPDGKAYLIAHGNTRPGSTQTWIRGDHIYLARVRPSPKSINDISKYEFFAGHNRKGAAVWSSKFADIRPIFEWNDRTGCVTMTYNAPLRKYLMCVSTGESVHSTFDTYILESSSPTGPWKLVTYMEQFGRQAYFVNIPSKFISADGKTMWLCYSANWTGYAPDQPGNSYAMCLREMRLLD